MYTVFETPVFLKSISFLWPESDRMEFIEWIACNPYSGDVIPGSGGLRKVRWKRLGHGKQGGIRVIYFNLLTDGEIHLLIAYTKSKFDNLSNDFLLKLKRELSND